MNSFTDNKFHRFDIEINISIVRKINSRMGVDMLNDVEDFTSRIISDPIFMVDTLWIACESQARSYGMDDEAFGESLAGDCIGNARTSLLDSIRDFFPTCEERDVVGAAVIRGMGLAAAMRRRAITVMEGMDADAIAAALMPGITLTNAPGSSESIPDDLRSVN
jgi:hypothetical protein